MVVENYTHALRSASIELGGGGEERRWLHMAKVQIVVGAYRHENLRVV